MIPTIDNIGITAADVRLRDVVVGRPIETFKGKSTCPPQLPSSPSLAPRVTQKQQVLIIDIMYILGIPFLLGLLDPLGLLMVKHLKDRTSSVIKDALITFKTKANSRC